MRIPLSLLFVCTAPLAAQATLSFPIDSTTANTSQNIPIAGGSIASWDEAHSQFFWPRQYLPGVPSLLNGLDWATGISNAIPYERFEIYLGTATGPTLTTTFAANLANPMLVYSLSNGSISWTPGWAGITFTQPYVYDGVSDLVIEVRKKIDRPNNPTIPQATQALYAYPYRTDLPLPIWTWGTYGSGEVDGATARAQNNTLLMMRLHVLGVPTLTIDSSRNTAGNGNRGWYHIGATVTNTVMGNAGEFFGIFLDLGLLPAPTTAPLFTGQLWLVPSFLLGTGVLDTAGVGSNSFTIANNPSLIGIHGYLQAGTLGAAGGTLTNITDLIVQPF